MQSGAKRGGSFPLTHSLLPMGNSCSDATLEEEQRCFERCTGTFEHCQKPGAFGDLSNCDAKTSCETDWGKVILYIILPAVAALVIACCVISARRRATPTRDYTAYHSASVRANAGPRPGVRRNPGGVLFSARMGNDVPPAEPSRPSTPPAPVRGGHAREGAEQPRRTGASTSTRSRSAGSRKRRHRSEDDDDDRKKRRSRSSRSRSSRTRRKGGRDLQLLALCHAVISLPSSHRHGHARDGGARERVSGGVPGGEMPRAPFVPKTCLRLAQRFLHGRTTRSVNFL